MTGPTGRTRPGPQAQEQDDFERLFPLAELELNVIRKVALQGRELCVVRTVAGLFAFGTTCPHKGGTMCDGLIKGTMEPSPRNEYQFGRDGEVVVCPWHGYEFDVRTGESVNGVIRGRLGAYPVEVRDGIVYGSLRRVTPRRTQSA
jgi:nitrite reductase (NADH) small subunit